MSKQQPPRRVAGIILAAGASLRMNTNKLLLPWGDSTIIGTVLANARAAALDKLLLVSGAERKAIEAIAAQYGVETVHNPIFAQGQSTSMQRGLAELEPGYAALFILGDQPLIGSSVYNRLADAYRIDGARIAVPRGQDGKRGNPCLFAPEFFAELRAVQGDKGGRQLLQTHAELVSFVEIGGREVLRDIDTVEQYQALRQPPHDPI